MKLTSTLPHVTTKLLLPALALAALSGTALAQGGWGGCPSQPRTPPPVYPGPTDLVPTAGAPAVPAPTTAPMPAGPSTPAPATPAPNPGQVGPQHVVPTTGLTLGDVDSSLWRHWWDLNKEPYLGLRTAVRSAGVLTGSDDFFLGGGPDFGDRPGARVTDASFQSEILPALLARLDEERSTGLLATTLLALGEAGSGRDGADECLAQLISFADDGRAPVAEAATIALGVLAHPGSLDVLEGLLSCRTGWLANEYGLDFGAHVPTRQRAFAAYALGLVAAETDDYVRTRIVNRLTSEIMNEAHGADEVQAAAVLALGLAPLPISHRPFDATRRPQVQMTRQEQVRWLLGALDESRLPTRVRAMVPTSLGRLLRDVSEDVEARDVTVQRLVALLRPRSGERPQVRRSCALALGWVADCDDDELDTAAREALIEAATELADQQTRHFALIALGRAAGRPGSGNEPLAGVAEVRKMLGRTLARGSTPVRPWSALAIAVLERSLDDLRQPSSDDMKVALRAALRAARTPDETGALAIAVGITRNPEAARALREKLGQLRDDQARADVAVALGMVGDASVMERLRALIEDSRTRAVLQEAAATGLVLIGDKAAAATLAELFEEAKSQASQVSLLAALGRTGDARSVDLLRKTATSSEHTSGTRAAAISALGCIAERADLPWTAHLSVGASYLSDVGTLTTLPRGGGVLDLRL
jgi:HEAT repeat protein